LSSQNKKYRDKNKRRNQTDSSGNASQPSPCNDEDLGVGEVGIFFFGDKVSFVGDFGVEALTLSSEPPVLKKVRKR
jgi:hypothetical protein